MKKLWSPLFILITLVGFAQPSIIPMPNKITMGNGSFVITSSTVLAVQDEQDRKTAELFNQYLHSVYGFKLDIDKQEGKDYIRLTTRKFTKAPEKDAYQLHVSDNGVSIEGDSYTGTFYGIQTLIQLLPVEIPAGSETGRLKIPFLDIQDAPRFQYRGMHLDVTRHFFPVSYVKKYIDYLALHKMNYFHWHLTDDQGWRIEIKKYPELQSVAAWRNGTIIGRYPGTANDNIFYGGFYTQEEVKDIVRYAAERHITVIPEIEMPGHASAAIAAYPWLSCFPDKPTRIPSHPSELSKQQQAGGKIKLVQETWGIFEDVFCAGNDSTFMFLQDVLNEVMELFPSTYIHVGGDESPKTHWKKCPRCQQRIREEGLKDEHELQSYFVQRMEKYLNNKGRIIIGWDEILEGGLAPNAIVMSWRGEKGGIEAAKQNHYVIMTPQKPLYFDHTQTKNEDSVVIGGYNPLDAVYAYDPVPEELPKEKQVFILGAQANLWAEYIKYPSKVEYHIFPRMSALSEVLWTNSENKSYSDFERRLPDQFKRYELWNANYSKAYYDLKSSIIPDNVFNGLTWNIESKMECEYCYVTAKLEFLVKHDTVIYDTIAITDKDNPAIIVRYETKAIPKKAGELMNARASGRNSLSLNINQTGKATATQIIHHSRGRDLVQEFFFNKATGKKVWITKIPNEKYPGQGGEFSLVNGVYSNKGLSYPDWLGWIGDDMEATIDLGNNTSIDSVRMHTLNQNGSWVYLPQYVEVHVSDDGKKFKRIGKANATAFRIDTLTMGWINIPVKKNKARYVKVVAKNYGKIPDGLPGAGTKAWLFADEIQVF